MRFWKTLVAAISVAAASAAQAGPLSTLYLTYTGAAGYTGIAMVQGNSISSFALAYEANGIYEIPIAVDGDVRTTAYYSGGLGGQYTLSGTPTGTTYTNPGFEAYDGTTDGTYNYVVDYRTGDVIRTDRDYQNPVVLFNVGAGHLGITYDPDNNSLWISGWGADDAITNYSMSGTVLSAFSTGFLYTGALALDHADNTLWLVDDSNSFALQQFSKAGALLSSGPAVNYTLGGEFDLDSASVVPEPSGLLLMAGALLLLARRGRRVGAGVAA